MCSAPGKSWMQLPLLLSPYSHTPVSLLEKERGRFNRIWGRRQAAVFLQRWTVCLKMIHTLPLGREKPNTEAVWKAKADSILLWHMGKKGYIHSVFHHSTVINGQKHVLETYFKCKKTNIAIQMNFITFHRANSLKERSATPDGAVYLHCVVLEANAMKWISQIQCKHTHKSMLNSWLSWSGIQKNK